MAQITSTNVAGILKNLYDRKTLAELENLETPFYGMLSTASDAKIAGAGFIFGVMAEGFTSAAARAEGAAAPAPGNFVPKQVTVPAKKVLAQVQIDGLAKALAGGGDASFGDAWQVAIDRELKGAMRMHEMMAFNDGTGTLAQFNAPSGNTSSVAQAVDGPGAQWLHINDRVDIFNNSTNVKVVDSAVVTDVDPLGDTITLDDDYSGVIADNYYIYKAGEQTVSGTQSTTQFTGLAGALASSGTYFGLSRTTYRNWRANVIDAGSTSITEDLLQRACGQLEIVSGSGMAGYGIVAHPDQRRRYLELVLAQKRFSGLSLDAGHKVLEFNGMPFITSYKCQPSVIYMGNFKNDFQKVFVPGGELKVDTEQNGQAVRPVPGYDSQAVLIKSYGNFICRKPNNFVKISALTGVTSR